MIIRELNTSDYNTYSALAAIHGSIFNSLNWLTIYGNAVCLNGIYNDNNDLIGAFFYYKATKFGIPYIVNPPLTPNNGLFFINPSLNKSNQNTFEKDVIELVANYLKSLSAVLLVTSLPVGFKDTQPFSWKKFTVQPKYTYQIDLSLSETILMSNITSEKRKSLKRAEKDQLQIKKEDNYKIVYDLILKTFNRQKKKVNSDLLNSILFETLNASNSIAFVAYKDGQPIATSLCVFDTNAAYYILGGYDEQNKHHGAGVSTMWSCIIHAKSIGLKIFDFEGSMLPDVEKYFREFGGTMVPYFAITKASLPVEFALKFFKRNLI